MTMSTVGCLFAPKLPVAIRKARARAVEHPSLFAKGHVIALVQVLISYTNLDSLFSPVLFNRSKPATIIGISTRTIDRLLGALEELGWLQRLKQPRLKGGEWGVTSISWAPWVIKDIFALSPKEDKWGNKVGKGHTPARNSEPSVPQQPPQHPYQVTSEESEVSNKIEAPSRDLQEPETKGDNSINPESSVLGHRATNVAHLSTSPKGEVLHNKVVANQSISNTFDPFNEKKKRGRRIPEDLVKPMLDLELTPSNICWLMSLCKKAGTQLQHILAVSLDAINNRKLKSSQALAYLRYMVGLGKDFKHLAQEKTSLDLKAQRTARRRQWLETLADLAFTPGRALPNGMKVLNLSNDLVFLEGQDNAPTSASPKISLIKSLLRTHPHWVRKLPRARYQEPSEVIEPLRNPVGGNEAAREGQTSGRKTYPSYLKALRALVAPKRSLRATPTTYQE